MRYMMFVATDPEAEPFVAEEDDIGEWVADVDARGVRLFGERLRPVQDASVWAAGEELHVAGAERHDRRVVVEHLLGGSRSAQRDEQRQRHQPHPVHPARVLQTDARTRRVASVGE